MSNKNKHKKSVFDIFKYSKRWLHLTASLFCERSLFRHIVKR